MNILFEEQGEFKVGTVLADNDTSLQVATASGKRAKVKAANVLLRFESGSVTNFIADAQRATETIDVDFLWHEGTRLLPDTRERDFSPQGGRPVREKNSQEELDLFFADWTFGTEELSGYSPFIQQVEEAPRLLMASRDGARLGLKDKDPAILHLDGGELEVELRLSEKMAPGVLVLPRHRGLLWQKVKEVPARISPDRITKK